jgi:transposase IS116/IS110/IS902 family protein
MRSGFKSAQIVPERAQFARQLRALIIYASRTPKLNCWNQPKVFPSLTADPCTNATPAATDSGPSDAAILRSLPGVGTVTLATLLTEAADPLARRDYAALRTLSGVAPVTKRSGKSCVVVMRYAAQIRLRNAVFHWARTAVQNDPKCRARYEALRARGHSYGRALRGVADRLLGVACVLLRRQVPFDPDHGTPAAP